MKQLLIPCDNFREVTYLIFDFVHRREIPVLTSAIDGDHPGVKFILNSRFDVVGSSLANFNNLFFRSSS